MRSIEPYKRIEDARGVFIGILNSGRWEEINYIETRGGETRGGHYHEETIELFFIIEGEIDVRIKTIGEGIERSLTVRGGTVLVVDPLEVHTFFCRTDCKWINVLSRRMDEHLPDIRRPDGA